MSYLPGKCVWIEHLTNGVAKAHAVYETLCGWADTAMPMRAQPYDLVMNGKHGIGGFRNAEPGMPSHWASYLSVPDVDKSFAAATAAGAKSLLAPTTSA